MVLFQVTSRLEEASRADVNSSLSPAVEEIKHLLNARILALELLVSHP